MYLCLYISIDICTPILSLLSHIFSFVHSMMCKQVRWGEPIPAECTFVMTKRSRKGKRQHIDKQTLTRMRLEHLFDRVRHY